MNSMRRRVTEICLSSVLGLSLFITLSPHDGSILRASNNTCIPGIHSSVKTQNIVTLKNISIAK